MRHRITFVVAAILVLAQTGPASAASGTSLQSAFAAAAREFRVPQNVLLGTVRDAERRGRIRADAAGRSSERFRIRGSWC